MGVKEGEEKEKGIESLVKEIMAEYFPNLGVDMDIQTHETKYPQARSNKRRFPQGT